MRYVFQHFYEGNWQGDATVSPFLRFLTLLQIEADLPVVPHTAVRRSFKNRKPIEKVGGFSVSLSLGLITCSTWAEAGVLPTYLSIHLSVHLSTHLPYLLICLKTPVTRCDSNAAFGPFFRCDAGAGCPDIWWQKVATHHILWRQLPFWFQYMSWRRWGRICSNLSFSYYKYLNIHYHH